MKVISVLFLIIFGITFNYGQSIAFYGDVMINADKAQHRQYAAEKFEEMLSLSLAEPNSFEMDYSELPWISIQYSADSTFRVITWQIDLDDGKFAYNGFYQQPDQLVSLGGKRGRKSFDNNDQIPFENWRGGLVYKILQAPENSEIHYLLTYVQQDEFTKVKTLEPLKVQDGKPVVGIPSYFKNDADPRAIHARLSLRYSVDSNASFILDEDSKRIVYDNLVLVQGRIPGQGPAFVPDGSYKAYELTDSGSWIYVDKLYDRWNEGPLDPDALKKRDQRLFKKKN